MTIGNMENAEGHHRIRFNILSQKMGKNVREFDVHASESELDAFMETGYLMKDKLFQGEELERLRTALDRLEEKQRNVKEFGQHFSTNSTYGGLYMRRLPDKEQVFMDLVYHPALLSIGRAMMGPQVMVSTMARITYPGEPNQETQWHQHLRHIPVPLPRWFVRPHSIDILIYLDDIDDETGPISIVPGSHDRMEDEPEPEYYGEYPDQMTFKPSAGTALFIHSNLWHRAMPTTPKGKKRRMVLVCYHPTWFKRSWSDNGDGLVKAALENGNEETLELFGKAGFM
jgi:ectoine hydroxylase-related dioxygenase (phytanoyl-CoA dioxygenase family)